MTVSVDLSRVSCMTVNLFNIYFEKLHEKLHERQKQVNPYSSASKVFREGNFGGINEMPFLVRKFLASAKLLRALIKQHAVSVRRTIPTFHFPAGAAANILSILNILRAVRC